MPSAISLQIKSCGWKPSYKHLLPGISPSKSCPCSESALLQHPHYWTKLWKKGSLQGAPSCSVLPLWSLTAEHYLIPDHQHCSTRASCCPGVSLEKTNMWLAWCSCRWETAWWLNGRRKSCISGVLNQIWGYKSAQLSKRACGCSTMGQQCLSEWYCCGSCLQVCVPFPELGKPSLSCPGSSSPCLPQAAVAMALSLQTPVPWLWSAPMDNGFHQCRNHPFFPTFPTPWLQFQFAIQEKYYLGWWIEQVTFSPVFSISWHSLLLFLPRLLPCPALSHP